MERIIEEADLPAWRICLEVTESALMEVDAASEVLRRLKRVGVQLAIDDFGTGHSSLSRLRGFPVDYLKIDRSFVAGIAQSSEDRIIVSSVVGLAHSLGLSVIAEGIEDARQLELLVAEGCEAGQGFLWGAAVPIEKASAMVSLPGLVRLRQLQRRRIGDVA